jgi:cellulose synthase/poly-beta-1,6-N-acetylglucosamine synthase-like glycosyltransferase
MTDILGLSSYTLAPPSASLDDICVVIPAFNEELLVGRCIDSVLAAGVAHHNIYVVDDQSTDRTAQVAADRPGVNVLVNDTRLGKLRGLRRAIDDCELLSRYRYLALLDADSHVSRNYFADVLARFSADPHTALVCGAPESEPHNWVTAYRALEYAVTLHVFKAGQDALRVITVAPGCASIYSTRVLAQLAFDGRTLVEDMDLTVQIHRKTLGRVTYVPTAVTFTQDPRTLREYVGQLTRWYSGTWQVMRLHKLPFGGQRIDAEFALVNIEGLIYSLLFLLQPLLLLIAPSTLWRLLAIDQAVWLALALGVAIRWRRRDVLVSFPSFLVLRYVSCGVILYTFWQEVIRSNTRSEWFSVARYQTKSCSISELERGNA